MKTAAIIFTALSLSLEAQRVQPDMLNTSKGKLEIQPIFHSAIVFTFNDKTIYVDPYGGANAYTGLKAPDLVLLTDIHPDHLDPQTWGTIDLNKARIIAPQAVADQIPANFRGNVTVLSNNNKTEVDGISIEAIPMYNLPETSDSKHPRGRGNGYVLTFGDKRVYISGDTEDIDEMRKLKNIDVAFVCMNLPYTMDVNQASSAVLEFKPKIVYPFHYRGQSGFSDTNEFKTLVNKGDKSIEVRLRDWYMKF
jgi:L-ascorbate metabolism protein UlaG (beta-lactamase superfamily)